MTPVVTYGELLGGMLGAAIAVVVALVLAKALFRRPRRSRFHVCPYCPRIHGGVLANALCTSQSADYAWCMRCGAFYLRVWGYWERPDPAFPESYRRPAVERNDP